MLGVGVNNYVLRYIFTFKAVYINVYVLIPSDVLFLIIMRILSLHLLVHTGFLTVFSSIRCNYQALRNYYTLPISILVLEY